VKVPVAVLPDESVAVQVTCGKGVARKGRIAEGGSDGHCR
jgi:hypothetical protein